MSTFTVDVSSGIGVIPYANLISPTSILKIGDPNNGPYVEYTVDYTSGQRMQNFVKSNEIFGPDNEMLLIGEIESRLELYCLKRGPSSISLLFNVVIS